MDRGCIILGSLLLALACAGCGRSPESGKVIDAGLRWNWNGGADATGLADGWDGDGGLLDDAGVADALARPADALPDGALPDGAFPGDGGTETSGVDGGGDDGSVGPEVIEVPVEDVECHFIPEVGEFTPVLECYWDDPVEKTKHDDVVMAPVVANLTDDNHDGVVDLKDTPDIAFLTYRREEDGCCNTPAVLRVVSGSCQGALEVQGGEGARLHEHFWIAAPVMDNSGGLAIGDIDGDGRAEIVAMKNNGGTVAFSEVKYASHAPESLVNDGAGWTVVGGVDAAVALSGPQPDDPALVAGGTEGAPLVFDWTFSTDKSIAIASVKVIAHARVKTQSVDLSGLLRSGGNEVVAEPVTLHAQEGWRRLVFEFPHDPFSGEKMWTPAGLASLQFGLVNQGPSGVQLEVGKLELVVGWVEQEWTSSHPSGSNILTAVQPAIADLDKDGVAEVLVGRVVLDGPTGELRWKGSAGLGTNSFFGPISSAADIDLDGELEVLAGNTAYRADGSVMWTYSYPGGGSGCDASGYPCDGFNATGNFDEDEFGEVVIIRRGELFILEETGTLKARLTLPGDNCNYNEGGPPTVADFDGDAFPEVGVAGADFYVVFDLECCASLPQCTEIPAGTEVCSAPGIRWKVANWDCSSRVTGSSVFDFEGDGQAEVIYNDEKFFRIFRGADGEVLFEKSNLSHTRLEYPLVADTDGDGNAEIVIVENGKAGYDHVPLQLWGDAQNRWVPTRRIWNQHTYHITNITELGLLPPGGEQPNWLIYNNYRQNLPDFDPFLAPDLAAEMLAPSTGSCPEALELRAKVCNLGQLWAPPGVSVFFLDGASEQALTCDEPSVTPVTLEPGQCVVTSCTVPWVGSQGESKVVRVCVDAFDFACTGPGIYNECNEENNGSDMTVSGCMP